MFIEVGEGYYIILIGMVEIFGVEGDSLLVGELVGIMGVVIVWGFLDFGMDGLELYFEFRKNGDLINFWFWIIVEKRKVSG